MSKSITVVGAGIAGLSAAYDLQNFGHQVKVFDRNSFPGGRMADQNINGINIHTGASIIFSFNREMFNLIDELGIRSEVVDYTDDTGVVIDDGTEQYELSLTPSVSSLLEHKAFSIATKVKLANLLPDLITSSLKTDPCLMSTATIWDDETVADYITRKVGSEFLEKYVEPFFRAPWHWEPENISKAYLLSLLGHIVTGYECTFKQGIGYLTRVLADKVDLNLSTVVERISTESNGKRQVVISNNDITSTIDTDIVVCATEGIHPASLVNNLDEIERRFFRSVRYNRGARLYFALKEPTTIDKGVWFTRQHSSSISLFHIENNDRYVPLGFQQPPYIQAELTPETSACVANEQDQGTLQKYIKDDLQRLYPQFDQNITAVAEQWWDAMLTEWRPGYAREMAAFLKHQESQARTLYYCGDYLSHSHTGGACASGRNVARLICKHLEMI